MDEKVYTYNSIWQNSCDHTGSCDQMISSTDLNPTRFSIKLISTIHLKDFQIDTDERALSTNQNRDPVIENQSEIELIVSIWKPDNFSKVFISF